MSLRNLVRNSARGRSFAISDEQRLDRFLILGVAGGSCYASERQLTAESADVVRRLLHKNGPRTVQRIVEVSEKGLAPKNDQAVFALAMALKLGDEKTRRLAAQSVPRVCRIGTHVFQLAEAVQAFGGWGRVTARAFARVYEQRAVDELALDMLKYRQRNGWSHKDVLAKSHARADDDDDARAALFSYVARDGDLSAREVMREKNGKVFSQGSYPARVSAALPRIVEGFEKIQAEKLSPADAASTIVEYGLPREMVPTEQLASADVWHALLHAGKHGMPLGALVRNLGKMTSTGLLSIGSDAARFVVEKLADARAIEKARLHPMSLLIAQRVYASGHGDKGKLAWHPVASIVDALDRAFYLAFRAVTATHKRHLLALDVSGSMASGRVAGSPLSPREASAAMALVTANVEDNTAFTAFTDKLVSLDLSARMSLRDAVAKVSGLRFGATDCAQPMLYALEKKLNVDVFVVYTDAETWAGKVKPHDALTRYREATGINAKLVVVGMVSNGFSIADPNDAGMLDVVGFSTETPQALAAFVNE